MLYLTKNEVDQVIANTNGFDMTYGDLLDNTNVEYEVIEGCDHAKQTYYYTDDLIAMYGICNACGARVAES